MDTDIILSELQALKSLTLLSAKQVLTMTDASLLTGLSKSHLYKLVGRKAIPHYKSGGKITYFDRDELNKFMLQHRVKTAAETEQDAANYIVTGKRGGKK